MKKKWKKNLLNSKYYQNYLISNKSFPPMNKENFMKNFDEINTVGLQKEDTMKLAIQSEKSRDFSPSIKGISIGLSSGTSGNRGIFLANKKEKAIWVAAILDRVIGFSFRKRKIAFFLRANNNLYESVKSRVLSFTFFDIKTPIEQHMDALNMLKADILVAQPSVLLEIAKNLENKKEEPSFRKIISVAEILELDQKEYFERIFKCQITQVYQCTEGFLAYTCKHGKLHFNEDWLEIEKKYVDENRTRFHPVITDYIRTSQPIINYELNDIIQEGPTCSCGSKSTVIHKIEGRADDVFRFQRDGKEIIIYPDFIRRTVIIASEKITNYVVVLTGKRTISVYLEVTEPWQLPDIFLKVKNELRKMLFSFGIEDIGIVSVDRKHNTSNKFIRIRNEYSKRI